jgi:CheY-like chemotaxis protein
MLRQTNEPVTILLVEDNPAEVQLASEAFLEWSTPMNLHSVSDGVEALSFLRREAPFESAPRPELMLLDVNLPKMDGKTVLSSIKGDPDLASIPVIVMTTSTDPTEIKSLYQLHANAFVPKPMDLNAFFDVIKTIETFWIHTATLP